VHRTCHPKWPIYGGIRGETAETAMSWQAEVLQFVDGPYGVIVEL
jgi:hypothetical protein